MQKTLAERLLSRRKELNLTQDDLAKKTKTTRVAISNIELGISTNVRATTLFSLAKALYCDPMWLLTGEQPKAIEQTDTIKLKDVAKYVPLINFVQAGAWTTTMDDINLDDAKMIPCPVRCSDKTFALQVVGESMEPRFEDGDIIFVDPTLIDPEPGKFVVAMLTDEHEATFKEFQKLDGQKMLKALNPNYPPDMRYVKINGNCRLVGTVVSHVKPV
ncbi:putative HTH-type transcriptional regulator [Photobacterium damselae subsp. damselae]|uniref:LexA family protein n=1 Tax=Photobacterium damselae TaxID=38293 RepID=UPI00109B957D|nr:S24 family peptidase [Photobacterium damselae]TGZ35349.1 putative HTH-type transcriptional regulator [Photobacterium damselae subsp. damselae]